MGWHPAAADDAGVALHRIWHSRARLQGRSFLPALVRPTDQRQEVLPDLRKMRGARRAYFDPDRLARSTVTRKAGRNAYHARRDRLRLSGAHADSAAYRM